MRISISWFQVWLSMHPINADRKLGMEEGFRVLKPEGRITIADIRATAIYEEALRRLGDRMWNTAGWGGDAGGATRSPVRPSPVGRNAQWDRHLLIESADC